MYDLGGRGFSCKLVCPKVLCRGRSRLTYGKLGMKEWILLVAPVWVQGLGFGVERAMDPYSSPYLYDPWWSFPFSLPFLSQPKIRRKPTGRLGHWDVNGFVTWM